MSQRALQYINAARMPLTEQEHSLKVGICLHSQQVHNKLYSDHYKVLRSTYNNLSQLPTTCCESWSHSYSHNMSWLLTTCCAGRPEHPSQLLLFSCCESTWAPCCGLVVRSCGRPEHHCCGFCEGPQHVAMVVVTHCCEHVVSVDISPP